MRGGEKVLEALCRLFPQAEIFTLFCQPGNLSPFLRSRRIHTSFLNPLRRIYRGLLPLAPLALESFDLRGYDLVISSESGPAKGVIVSSTARHVCYCHTPMRYLWELYPFYRNDIIQSGLKRALLAPLASYLRLWDYASAARVDTFVANSENVRRRIRRAYGRSARVVYPPVEADRFEWRRSEDYYLIVSELAAYKRIDYAVRWFARSGRRLRIAGDGAEYRRLKALAGGRVEFCGRVSDDEIRRLYASANALIMPGEEDFGLTMVESLASGKPVIGLGRGGAVEIVKDHCGILFNEPREADLERGIRQYERDPGRFDPDRLRLEARRFSLESFAAGLRSAIEDRPWTGTVDEHEYELGPCATGVRQAGKRRESSAYRPLFRRG